MRLNKSKAIAASVGSAVVLLVGTILISSNGCAALGAAVSGERLVRAQASKQWNEDRFVNSLPQHEPQLWTTLKRWLFDGSDDSFPENPITVTALTSDSFLRAPESGVRITWLGHSTSIIEIDGLRLLVDPVWGENAAPFSWLGVDRFYPPPLPFDELPAIDAVIISHDHYDHLDYPTILKLKQRGIPFLVPLGVGAHLEYWGVERNLIVELDWWESFQIADTTLVATPSRHFSGRSLTDRDETLWAGWAVIGREHRIFYSGDTAMFPELKEIGARYGPFDFTMIESGAYNQLWADVHLGPEQAVQAHLMVRGEIMIPVHWGLFDLAMHSWTEPIERVTVAAKKHGVHAVTLRPGDSVEPGNAPQDNRWWPDLPWETAEKAPVVSSGLK